MSFEAERKTAELIQGDLPYIAEASWRRSDPNEIVEAYVRFHHHVDEVMAANAFDSRYVRKLAESNAERLDLDTESADRVIDVSMRPPGNGSLASMHAPSRQIWQGTGANMTTDHRGELVHYLSLPGIVENKYGLPEPFILRQLGQSLMCRALGLGTPDTNPGYSQRREILQKHGLLKPEASLHIGATFVKEPNGNTYHGSASGALVEPYVDEFLQRYPYYADRAELDREAGLYEWEYDRRAGLYDIMFAKQVIKALQKGINTLTDTNLRQPGLNLYDGVDIN